MAYEPTFAPGAMDAESENLRRRYVLAQELQKPLSNPQGGQMVGNYFVANPWQIMADVYRGQQGREQENALMQEAKDLQATRQQQMADALSTYGKMYSGTPEQQFAGPAPEGAPQEGGYTQAGVKGSPLAAAQFLAGQQNPQLAQLGVHQLTKLPEIEAAKQAQLQQAMLEMQNKNEQRALDREARMDLARFSASNRPEKMVTVLGPNGEAVSLPQSQAGGMQLYNPMAAKEIQKQKAQGEAKQQLSDIVGSLKGNYDALNKNFGIASTDNRALSNIGARIGSSGVGQLFGGALGTQNQQYRQEIEQTRPLLLNAIKNATGMSAQQMNSNAELTMYLKAATDPTLSYEANMKALQNLDKMFGLGINFPKEAQNAAPTGLPNADAIAAELARRGGK